MDIGINVRKIITEEINLNYNTVYQVLKKNMYGVASATKIRLGIGFVMGGGGLRSQK